MKSSIYFLFLLLISTAKIGAQREHSWPAFHQSGELRSIYQQTIRFNDKYSSSVDGGSYLGVGKNNWHRWGLRGGVINKLNYRTSLELGFMYNRVSSATSIMHEYRPHQSVHFTFPVLKHSAIQHRLQLEERLFKTKQTSTDFSTRIRYQISNRGTLNKRPVTPKSFYYRASMEWNFNIYNEIKGRFLLRGRYGLGYGYQLNSSFSVDATYFFEHNASQYSPDHSITNILQVTLRHNIRRF